MTVFPFAVKRFSAAVFVFYACAAASGGVSGTWTVHGTPESWRPHAFMGSDYRLLLSEPLFLESLDGGRLMKENLSLSESAWEFRGWIPGKRDYVKSGRPGEQSLHPVPSRVADRPRAPYGIRECFGGRVCEPSFTNRPFFLSFGDARPVYWLPRESPLADRAAFSAWVAQHPNFIGFEGFDELDSDCTYFDRFLKSPAPADPSVQKTFRARYPYPPAGRGVPFADWVRTAYPGQISCYFGSGNIWPLASNAASFLPICASMGAEGLFYEATTQSHGPWALAGAYLRGAARQWSIPWAWYGANWYGGVPRNDRLKWPEGENKWCCLDNAGKPGEPAHRGSRYARPYRGASRSILERQAVYGWLIGSSFYWPEHWNWLFISEKDGKHVLSDVGRDFEEFYRLTKRTDRGVSLTPLAVLTPVGEPMLTTGWCEGFRDAFTQTAVFHTLIPLHCPSRWRYINRTGNQGCLYNSRYGEIFDVVTADSGQPSGDFAAALSPYRFALLAGNGFDDGKLDRKALEAYVRGGGTLIVSADQIDRGYVSPEIAGVSFGKNAYRDGTHVCDGTNLTFLLDTYAVREARLRGAEAVAWTDREKRPVVFENTVGRGKVMSVACDRFLPARYGSEAGRNVYREEYERISSCRQTFELLKFVFDRIQDRALPVKVSGDIQFGVNLTAKGLLVWLFNNKGVVKFTDEPEVLELSGTAYVTIDLKDLTPDIVVDVSTGESLPAGGEFGITVPPGAWRMIRIEDR